jgi:hemolysin III
MTIEFGVASKLRKPRRFFFWRYIAEMLLQFSLLIVAIRFFLPRVYANQFASGYRAIILVFLGGQLFNCFAEWAFHRYLLHTAPLRWLRSLATKHRHHHSLTPIRLQREDAGSGRIVLNRYPIEREEQRQNAMFPHWSLVAFWATFAPFWIGLQICFPHAPFLLGGFAAVTWSLVSYETFHHIEHLPYEWWKRRVESRYFGIFWTKIYGFHHMHHANVGCNEAISGFFGLPLADWSFRTYHQPRALLLDGRVATARDFALRQPPMFILWIDRRLRTRETHHNKSAQ